MRTAELDEVNRELARSEQLAALGRLMATIAHELRNPLGTVRNTIFVLRESVRRQDTSRVNHSLDLAERNVVRCDAIITQLLDYVRGRDPAMELTDIDEWLTRLCDEMHPPDGVTLETHFVTGIRLAVAREGFRRAVVNVMENAFHAVVEPGSVEPWVRVSAAVTPTRLEIAVQDRGSGMAPEVKARVFELLYSTKSFGVGLGLPTVERVLQDHEGGVEVETEEGAGTTFTLWIPLPPALGDQPDDG